MIIVNIGKNDLTEEQLAYVEFMRDSGVEVNEEWHITTIRQDMKRFKNGTEVKVLTGKYKGYKGYVMYRSEPFPLSPEKDVWAIRVQTGTIRGYITLRIQERNLEEVNVST